MCLCDSNLHVGCDFAPVLDRCARFFGRYRVSGAVRRSAFCDRESRIRSV
eukprot:GDKH01002519.1.p6 GENE.GDKH01002519.1~~GDKH01002519.1.p6  ORF type:complete len:50 (-),score=2.36 GDKH01002519.1:114-263(-)